MMHTHTLPLFCKNNLNKLTKYERMVPHRLRRTIDVLWRQQKTAGCGTPRSAPTSQARRKSMSKAEKEPHLTLLWSSQRRTPELTTTRNLVVHNHYDKCRSPPRITFATAGNIWQLIKTNFCVANLKQNTYSKCMITSSLKEIDRELEKQTDR